MPSRARALFYVSIVLLVLVLLALVGCNRKPAASDKIPAFAPRPKDALVVDCEAGRYGGRLVYAASAEPKTFNPLLVTEQGSRDIAERIHATLIDLHRGTQQLTPGLAKSWQFSNDRRRLDVHLREGVRFSDGHPFTADDVLFTFTVLLDPRQKLSLSSMFIIEGKPVQVEKVDAGTVRLIYPQPTVTAEHNLAAVPMLPQHKLEAAYRSGRLESAWNGSTPPAEVVGLGPFKIKEYAPGQRLTLERNLHYWKVDKAEARLPYLDFILFLFIPDYNARLLRFQSGEVDVIDALRPEDFASLQQAERTRGITVIDAGPDMSSEFMWFNQNPEANPKTKKPYLPPHKYRWFSDVRFRRAISHAIDRATVAQVGLLGKATPAYGPFNNSNKLWTNPAAPKYDYDPERAKALLREAGFAVRDGAPLQDRAGQRVEFSLITNAGNTLRQKIGSLIQQDLAKLGIQAQLTTMEFGALIQAITHSEYEACLLDLRVDDPDPAAQQSVWPSSGPMHAWYPKQKTPATEWERRLDQLMMRQMATFDYPERKRLVDEAQQVIAENVPFIYLVSRDVLVGTKRTVGNFKPSILHHRTLWNSEELYFRAGS